MMMQMVVFGCYESRRLLDAREEGMQHARKLKRIFFVVYCNAALLFKHLAYLFIFLAVSFVVLIKF